MSRASLKCGVATLAPVALLASCSEQDLGEAVEGAIVDLLAAAGRILLISLGLMIAWAAIVACAVALIVLGVRRRRFDAPTVASLAPGVALLVGAWPLVFSDDGLAGVLAPGSLPDASAGPLLLQGVIAAVVVGVIAFVVRRRRARRVAPGSTTPPPIPPAPPPLPPAPPSDPPPRSEPAHSEEAPRRPRAGSRPNRGARPGTRTPKEAPAGATKTRSRRVASDAPAADRSAEVRRTGRRR